MKEYELNKPNEEYRLNIGDRLIFESSLRDSIEIVYAGKPTDNIFSLLCAERQLFEKRINGNLFFPVDTKK